MYINKIIKKEVFTLLISVGLLSIVFIGVSFASFFKIDEGKDNVVETGDLAISFCNDSTCDTTYENIGQVIGTTKQDGTSVPNSIYPYPDDGTYSNATPYIFKVTNTGSMKATITIKLIEDTDFLPSGNYSEYTRLTDLYANHLKVAIRKRVLANGSKYQMGDVNLDGIVNQNDTIIIQQAEVGSYTLSDDQKNLADINGDGDIDSADAAIIKSTLMGKNTVLEKTHINLFSELNNSVIYTGDTIEPGESAIYFLWLYLDETTPNQAQKTYFVGNLDIQGEFIPDNLPFNLASWDTIISNVKSGNTDDYNVGDTKEIDLGDLGKHNVRIANKSTPSECSTDEFSQSACGFVLEFTDIVITFTNGSSSNIDGWPASQMYSVCNTDIYNSLPSNIKESIIDTKTVSGHELYIIDDDDSTPLENYVSTDKIYLLAPKEIYNNWSSQYDTAKALTRTLDYYKSKNVTTENYTDAIKKYNEEAKSWKLRTAYSRTESGFFQVSESGSDTTASCAFENGISPAFRIG